MILFQNLTIKRLIKKLKAMQQTRQLNQPTDEQLQKEIAMYMALSLAYESLNNKKKFPFSQLMSRESLRAAADLDSADAQYALALKLLEEAKCRDALEKDVLLANASNLKQSQSLFTEARHYLMAAEALGHILAKRTHGLCLINGWGADADKDKGFDLVMASIDQENSWDKIPQIFASIGLNKPEFFAALGKHRENK